MSVKLNLNSNLKGELFFEILIASRLLEISLLIDPQKNLLHIYFDVQILVIFLSNFSSELTFENLSTNPAGRHFQKFGFMSVSYCNLRSELTLEILSTTPPPLVDILIRQLFCRVT